MRLDRRTDIPSIMTYINREPNCKRTQELLLNLRNPDDPQTYRAYALTRQRINHDELDAKEIVGFCDGKDMTVWQDGKIFFIENLETKSITNKENIPDRKRVSFLGMEFMIQEKIKGVGKAILKSIVRLQDSDINAIQLKSVSETSDEFYKHIGFVKSKCFRFGWRLPKENFAEFLNK